MDDSDVRSYVYEEAACIFSQLLSYAPADIDSALHDDLNMFYAFKQYIDALICEAKRIFYPSPIRISMPVSIQFLDYEGRTIVKFE